MTAVLALDTLQALVLSDASGALLGRRGCRAALLSLLEAAGSGAIPQVALLRKALSHADSDEAAFHRHATDALRSVAPALPRALAGRLGPGRLGFDPRALGPLGLAAERVADQWLLHAGLYPCNGRADAPGGAMATEFEEVPGALPSDLGAAPACVHLALHDGAVVALLASPLGEAHVLRRAANGTSRWACALLSPSADVLQGPGARRRARAPPSLGRAPARGRRPSLGGTPTGDLCPLQYLLEQSSASHSHLIPDDPTLIGAFFLLDKALERQGAGGGGGGTPRGGPTATTPAPPTRAPPSPRPPAARPARPAWRRSRRARARATRRW